MNKKIDLIYSFLHVPTDVIALILAFISAYWLRGNGLEIFNLPYAEFLNQLYIIIPIWILIYIFQGMYTRKQLFATLQNIIPLALSSLSGWAGFIVYLVFTRPDQTLIYPRLLLLYVLVFAFVYVFAGRLILRFVQFVARLLGIGKRRVIIIGEGKLAEALEAAFVNKQDASIHFIKRIPADDDAILKKEIKKYAVEEIIIADQKIKEETVLSYIATAHSLGVVSHTIPNTFEVQASNVILSTLAGFPLVTFRQTPLEGWGRIVKRIIDVIVSAGALVVLSPLFLLFAILIKITDPGTVFYTQNRVARNFGKFKVYKFRSMKMKYGTHGHNGNNRTTEQIMIEDFQRPDLAEEYRLNKKIKNDPRVSSLGRFMRTTNIDELPQLINVLRGDISLVGPRPYLAEEVEEYKKHSTKDLFSTKPGMTGLWQVSGRNDASFDERVRLDTYYVQNWSLWQDFVIIVKTISSLIFGENRGY